MAGSFPQNSVTCFPAASAAPARDYVARRAESVIWPGDGDAFMAGEHDTPALHSLSRFLGSRRNPIGLLPSRFGQKRMLKPPAFLCHGIRQHERLLGRSGFWTTRGRCCATIFRGPMRCAAPASGPQWWGRLLKRAAGCRRRRAAAGAVCAGLQPVLVTVIWWRWRTGCTLDRLADSLRRAAAGGAEGDGWKDRARTAAGHLWRGRCRASRLLLKSDAADRDVGAGISRSPLATCCRRWALAWLLVSHAGNGSLAAARAAWGPTQASPSPRAVGWLLLLLPLAVTANPGKRQQSGTLAGRRWPARMAAPASLGLARQRRRAASPAMSSAPWSR